MNNEQLIRLQQDVNLLLARADLYTREPSGVTDNNYLVDRWINNLTQQDIEDEYCSYFKSVKKPAKRKVKKVYNFETFCNKMY
tara:strand:- start:468 stop:716 length:249 start_codon:yes stop_codon:yes gene_type:complete